MLVNTDTAQITALNQQAELYLKQGQLEKAIGACQEALQIDPQSVLTYKIMGNIGLLQGKIEQSQKHYLKAIAIDPNFIDGYINLGSTFAKIKGWQSAIDYYQKALHLNPKSAKTYRNLGKVWLHLNKASEAARCWYTALTLEPNQFSAQDCVNLGKFFIQQGEITTGIHCYRYAIEIDPNLWVAYQNLAHILKQQGQLEESKVYAQKAIHLANQFKHPVSPSPQDKTLGIDPNQVEVYLHLGDLLEAQQNGEAAVVAYRRAIRLDDACVEGYQKLRKVLERLNKPVDAVRCGVKLLHLSPQGLSAEECLILGNQLLKLGNIQEAVKSYRQAIILNPDLSLAYHNLGEIYRVQQQWDEAIAAYSRALELDPERSSLKEKLAYAFRERARWDLERAAHWYNQAVEANPEWVQNPQEFLEIKPHKPEIYLHLGSSLEQERTDEAISIYQMAIARFPNHAEIYFRLGKAWEQKSDSQQAMSAYQQAIAIEPHHCWSHHHIGDILAARGQNREAIASYTRAIETNPAPSFWHYHNLAMVQLRQGAYQGAMDSYRQAIEINPNYSWLHKNLGDLLAAQGQTDEATLCYRRAIKLQPPIF